MPTFRVWVSCLTYNHASFIVDAMNGFCMQKTNFPFVCTIVDDASTDGEQKVINDYILSNFKIEDESIIVNEETNDYVLKLLQHNSNSNCYFLVVLLKYNHYSIKKGKYQYYCHWTNMVDYIAICEGDDYWTNPYKLQRQVDFLDSHPDYSMCFHDAAIRVENGRERYKVFGTLENRDYSGVENMVTWSVPTHSIVCRNDVFKTRPYNPKFTMGDNVLILHCSRNGKIRCIAEKMGVYRLTPTSWIGGQSNKVQRYKYISHYLGLIEEFEECRCPQMYAILENQYFQLLTILKKDGNHQEYERVKAEYMNYPGETHWNRFASFYIKSRIRGFGKSILGKRSSMLYKKMRQMVKII